VKNLLHKDKEEKETHRTLRHIWLPYAQATASQPKEPSFFRRTG